RHTISKRDWSSDVCSSDLLVQIKAFSLYNFSLWIPDFNRFSIVDTKQFLIMAIDKPNLFFIFHISALQKEAAKAASFPFLSFFQIGRASCRERVFMSMVID